MKKHLLVFALLLGTLFVSPGEVIADCYARPPHNPDCAPRHLCIYGGSEFCCDNAYECMPCNYACNTINPGWYGSCQTPYVCASIGGTHIGQSIYCILPRECCCQSSATPTPIPTSTPTPTPSPVCQRVYQYPCPHDYPYECQWDTSNLFCCVRSGTYLCFSCADACPRYNPEYVRIMCSPNESDCRRNQGGTPIGETDGCYYPETCCCGRVSQTPFPLPTIPAGLLCNGDTGISSAIGCIPTTDINAFVGFFLPWAIGIGGGISFLLILLAGFIITTSAGNPDKVKAGKELLTAAVSGLLLIIFSLFILELFGVRIFRIPGL